MKERDEIKRILKMDIDSMHDSKIAEHYDYISECNFSPDALAPYAVEWFDHAGAVEGLMKEGVYEQRIDLLKREEKERKKEIEKLKEEKKLLQEKEKETENKEKESFLDENKGENFYLGSSLTDEQKEWLLDAGYTKTHQWDLDERSTQEIFVNKRNNERESHAYLTFALQKYLAYELGEDEVKLYETKLPDIVFKVHGEEWAIEIETGSQIKKSKKELGKKVKENNKKYGDRWFFVVTNKNLISKYRAFGDTFDRSKVLDYLDEVINPVGLQHPK